MAGRLDAESLLGSRGRLRVLRVLCEGGEMNVGEVARRAGLNHACAVGHLEGLRVLGLVRERRYGRIRLFGAVFNSLVVRFERGRGVSVERG